MTDNQHLQNVFKNLGKSISSWKRRQLNGKKAVNTDGPKKAFAKHVEYRNNRISGREREREGENVMKRWHDKGVRERAFERHAE